MLEQKWNHDVWVVLWNKVKDAEVFLHIEQETLVNKAKNIIYRRAGSITLSYNKTKTKINPCKCVIEERVKKKINQTLNINPCPLTQQETRWLFHHRKLAY